MPANASVYDQNGKRVPSQVVVEDGVTKLLVRASVAPVGYAVYDVRKGGASKKSVVLKASDKGMENSVYKLAVSLIND